MKIDKEKFNQLKQLDRIEFRQRYRNINEGEFSLEIPAWSFMIMAYISGTVGVVSSNIELLRLSIILIKISFLTVILHVAFSIFIFIFQRIKTKELEEEYFSVEIKK